MGGDGSLKKIQSQNFLENLANLWVCPTRCGFPENQCPLRGKPGHRYVCALQTGIHSADSSAHPKPSVRHEGLECGGMTPLWLCAERKAKSWSAARRKATSRRPRPAGNQSADVSAHSKRETKAPTCLRTPNGNRDACGQAKVK